MLQLIKVGETVNLNYQVGYENAGGTLDYAGPSAPVLASSSDTSIATVSPSMGSGSFSITGVAAGAADITFTALQSGVPPCKVHVVVWASTGSGGKGGVTVEV